jgi:alpha-N-acetylglucosaminidase
MYEYVLEKAWSDGPVNTGKWIANWAKRQYGADNENIERAWQILADSIYTQPSRLGQGTLNNARPAFQGQGRWTNPKIWYDNKVLLDAWELLLKAPESRSDNYKFDVANTGRQVLGNYFSVLRKEFSEKYNSHDSHGLEEKGGEMLQLLDDMDRLLSTQPSFLLGRWIEQAKSLGKNETERNYYERDARNILTTWGGKAQSLNDYANRSWADLTGSYYRKRWELFINEVIKADREKKPFDEKAFKALVTDFEWNWVHQNEKYSDKPLGDAVLISRELFEKYSDRIKNAGTEGKTN